MNNTKFTAPWLSLLLVCLVLPASAANKYWDSNAATAGSGANNTLGAWTTAVSHWCSVSAGNVASVAWADGDAAIFCAGTDATGTYTVSSGRVNGFASITVNYGTCYLRGSAVSCSSAASTITINSGTTLSYVSSGAIAGIAGSTMTINGGTFQCETTGAGGTFLTSTMGIVLGTGGGTLAVTVAAPSIYGGTISGTSLTKTGGGDLSITAAATYTGSTTVNNGYLRLRTGLPAQLPSGTDLIVNSPGGFDRNTWGQTVASLSGNGTVVGNSTLTITGTSSTTFSGVITIGSLTLNKSGGTGTLTLTGANTYTGATTITAGTLQLGDGSTSNGSVASTITDNATLIFANPSAQTYSLAISGTGTLTKQAAGTLTLGVANSYQGGTTLSGGKLQVGDPGALGTGTLALSSGTLCSSSTTGYTLSVPVNQSGDVTLGDSSNTGALTFQTGAWTLQNATRQLTVASPVTISSAIGDGGSGYGLTLGSGSTSTLTLSGANTYGGNTTISAGQIIINSTSTLGNAAGTLYLSGGTLTTSASRTPSTAPVANPINLSDNSTIATTSTAGTVDLNLSSSTVTATSGKTLTFVNNAASGSGVFQPRFSGSFTFAGKIAINNGTYGTTMLQSFNTTGTTEEFDGVISGTGSYNRTASTAGTGGKTLFTAANTYSAGTTVNDGTLEVGASGSIVGSVTVNSHGVLQLDNAAALQSSANLTLAASPNASTVNLNFSGTQTITALNFGTHSKIPGTWGASGSTATHQNAAFTTTTGVLQVNSGGANPTMNTPSITPSPACAGSTVSVAATISGGDSPSGNVAFYDGATPLGTAALSSGTATLPNVSFTVGTHGSITATYLGDDNNNPSAPSAAGSVTVNTRPTSAVSGSATICNGSSTAPSAALTGQGPWNVTWFDGTTSTTHTGVGGTGTTGSDTLTVSPSANTTYTVTALTDAHCTAAGGDLTGSAVVTVHARPASAVSGSATICNGSSTSIAAALSGTGPWNVSWSDGVNQNGVASSPATRSVSPSATTTYTVTSLTDANCTAQAGDLTGSAVVTVHAPPTAANSFTTNTANHTLIFDTAKLLAKATPGDSSSLSVSAAGPTSAQGPANNVLLDTGAGTITYTPKADYTGSDSFTYTISDGNGCTVSPTITVTDVSNSGVSPNVVAGPIFDSATGTFSVTFAGIPGVEYTVEYAEGAAAPPWSKLMNITAGSDGLFTVTDGPDLSGSRYYRTVYPSY